MSISAKLEEFLDQNHVRYTLLKHSHAYTAQELAAAAHVPGKEFAKVVMVKIDGSMAMVLTAAPDPIAFDLMAQSLGAKKVELATEDEFRDHFPDCETGAMPPFGNLYNLPVYVARPLTEDEEIVFNAGNHREAIRMQYEDFERLVKPSVVDCTRSASAAKS